MKQNGLGRFCDEEASEHFETALAWVLEFVFEGLGR